MIILFLGYKNSSLISFLREDANVVIHREEKINLEYVVSNNIDRIISYGYWPIIKEPILTAYAGRIINLHISYLPWNRGTSPNFWSVIDDTPKGVTIHLIDKGIDTGDILVQQEVEISEDITLRESYDKLQETIQELFKKNWQGLKFQTIVPRRQEGKGSYHQLRDKDIYIKEISETWLDLKISELKKYVHRKINREYTILDKQEYATGPYKMVPIRDKDKYDILHMRNEQIYHLRQAKPLTITEQELYFATVVADLFKAQKPGQLLFSYLHNDTILGYGGLVHINWLDKHAEISFIIETKLENDFALHWTNFLNMLKELAFGRLGFHKVFTYAFNLRPHLYEVLEENGFLEEARLKEHCFFDGQYIDVVIHSKFNPALEEKG